MADKKALIILNPVSGKARAKSKLFDMVSAVETAGYEATVHITTCRGDAKNISTLSAASNDLIVCCGGDGTLNEVISGIAETPEELRPELAYIPTGTTNDFAATLGISKDIDTAIKSITEGNISKVDIGKINDSYFTYVATFGIFTKTSYTTNQNMKNVLGHFAYLLEGVKELSDLTKTYRISMTYDGKRLTGDFIYVAVTNSTSMGGLIKLPSSKVDICDGTFEIMLIRSPDNMIECQQILQMLTQEKYDGDKIMFLQSKKIQIHSDQPIAWCIDGEFSGEISDVNIENLGGAITFRV